MMAFHLLLVSSPIRVVALGKRSITTFYLLWSCIWRQTQYIQSLLRSINGRAGLARFSQRV